MEIEVTTPSRLTRTYRVFDRSTAKAVGVVIAYSTAVAGVLLCHSIPHHVRVVVDNLTQCVGPFGAFLWCMYLVIRQAVNKQKNVESTPTQILPSLCFGMGALAFAVGQSIWSYYELKLNIPTPFPSWADAGYLTAYPFLFAGVLTLPANPVSGNRRLVVLFESLMFMAGVVTFSWYFILGPTVLQTGESTLARVLGTAYPLADLGLICCLLLLFVRSGSEQLKSVACTLASGLFSVVVIDSIFDYQTLHNTYDTGHVIDIGWTFGYMMIAVAGCSALKLKVTKRQQAQPVAKAKARSLKFRTLQKLDEIRPVLIQYSVVALVAGLLWETSASHGDHRLNLGVHVGAAVIVGLLLMRQFFMLLENQDLTNKMAAFNENLEEVVKERTHELGIKTDQLLALQKLTSAINDTLDQSMVVSAAAVNTQSAFNGTATAVWLIDNPDNSINSVPYLSVGMDKYSQVFKIAANTVHGLSASVQTISIPSEYGSTDLLFEYLQAPLRSRGALRGKIGIIRTAGNRFKQSELGLLDSICMHVATALENADKYWNARDAADRDALTGLHNHRCIHEYLDAMIEIERDLDESVTVILADIDNFRMFNDTYGHPQGDDVLCRVAAVLESTVAASARVGRYSGDEFIIVLPGLSATDAFIVAEQLLKNVSALVLRFKDDDRSIPVSMSFGIASFPEDSADRHDLIVTADTNLSVAKDSDAKIVALTEMKRAHRELRVSSSFKMLDGMVTAVDNKDRYTRRHSEDVTEYALLIADQIGMDNDFKTTLRTGGLLHDVGKIGVPDDILRKPGRLEEFEYNVMKQHPTLGALIVGGVPGMEDILDAVKYHHERWDGKGYPEGLAGECIPLIARILAVADAMSAMTTDRPYRKGMSLETALNEVRKNSGTQFDPEMANAFLIAADLHMTNEAGDNDLRSLRKAA